MQRAGHSPVLFTLVMGPSTVRSHPPGVHPVRPSVNGTGRSGFSCSATVLGASVQLSALEVWLRHPLCASRAGWERGGAKAS